MKKFEPKIRHDVQPMLDSLGFSDLFIAADKYGLVNLVRKCGSVCTIYGVKIGDDVDWADVDPIIALITDWMNDNFKTIQKLLLAVDEQKSFRAKQDPYFRTRGTLPKQVNIYEGLNRFNISYNNWKIQGEWNWEYERDGELISFRYTAASKKKRILFTFALDRRPETQHIELGKKIALWHQQYDKLTNRVEKLRNSLDTCKI